MNKKTITDIFLKNKKAFVRVDFNVPLSSKNPDDDIIVTDNTRIQAALPTLQYLLEQGASLILASHLGRPKSATDTHLCMKPVAVALSDLLAQSVKTTTQIVGNSVTRAAQSLQIGEVLLLENTRFHSGEKKNDPDLAIALAELADVFVNDAFGSAHRAHASNVGVAQAMQKQGKPAVAGFLLQKEIAYLGQAVANPPHPYVAIIGGAKVSDKILVIENLLSMADKVLIGGGMANTFLKAQGYEVGTSLVEDEALAEAKRLLATAGGQLILPMDVVITDRFAPDAQAEIMPASTIPTNKMALDIGPQTIKLFQQSLANAKLVVWNGPMGVFEFDQFAKGTNEVAALLAEMADAGTQVIIGGGDSAAAVKKAELTQRMSHVSTGGGASLELLEGKILPGIAVLDDA